MYNLFTIGGRITDFIAIYGHQQIKLSWMFLPLANICADQNLNLFL